MNDKDAARAALFTAGAAALRFNAPLGAARADELVDHLARRRPTTVVDLACGRGALAELVAQRLPDTTVSGVDRDEAAIAEATARVAAQPPDQRPTFHVADATTWPGPVDAALCIGASHAFGHAGAMFARLAEIAPAGQVIVGDGIWQATPDPWHVDTFGDLPVGTDELVTVAESAGWRALDVDTSTLTEWDEFDLGWIEGVRAVGTAEATAVADEREADYRRYRGVLGFCWLVLTR